MTWEGGGFFFALVPRPLAVYSIARSNFFDRLLILTFSCSSCRVHLLQLRTLHALIHRIRFCPNHWTPVPLEKGLSKI